MRFKGENRRFCSLKGQGILTKPVMIVLFIVATLVLINSVFSAMSESRLRERESMIRTAASNSMLSLQSIDCLGYEGPAKRYTNVLDVSKLDNFNQQYANIEPPCARNFDYGWSATVVERDRLGNDVRRWMFGAPNSSKGQILLQGVTINSPVGLWYSEADVRPGVVEVRFIEGELEKLAGLVDRSCFYQSSNAESIFLSRDARTFGNLLCMDKDCRQLLCPANIDLSKGDYYVVANYRDGRVDIVK